jgi:hypothetical protein
MQDKSKTMAKFPVADKGSRDDKILIPAEEDIEKQLLFEKLISRLSAEFINLPFDQVDKKIDDGLKLIVASLGIDRSLLHEFSEDKQTLRLSHFYVRPGIKKPTSIITSKDQPFDEIRTSKMRELYPGLLPEDGRPAFVDTE